MIKFYTNELFLENGVYHIPLLYAFWGCTKGRYAFGEKHAGTFDEYIKKGKKIFSLTDEIKDSDALLFPGNYMGNTDMFKKMYFLSKKYKKPMVVFFESDSSEKIPYDDIIIFRTSLDRNIRGKNEYSFPAWSLDYIKKYNKDKLIIKNKSERPTITYTGYVDYINIFQYIRYYIKEITKRILKLPKEYWWRLRGKCVRKLLNSNNLNMDFLQRIHFSGGSPIDTWIEFIKKIIHSDYSLVTRGKGNFSIRFYEVLSCGRIPVYLETGGVLPFEDKINYKELIVKFTEKDIKNLDKIIIDYNNELSNDDFIKKQEKIRYIYNKYLSPLGFFNNIGDYIKNYEK